VRVFDKFIACSSPVGYGIGEVLVIRGMGFVVVINGCSGFFILGDVASFEFWEIGFL